MRRTAIVICALLASATSEAAQNEPRLKMECQSTEFLPGSSLNFYGSYEAAHILATPVNQRSWINYYPTGQDAVSADTKTHLHFGFNSSQQLKWTRILILNKTVFKAGPTTSFQFRTKTGDVVTLPFDEKNIASLNAGRGLYREFSVADFSKLEGPTTVAVVDGEKTLLSHEFNLDRNAVEAKLFAFAKKSDEKFRQKPMRAEDLPTAYLIDGQTGCRKMD